MNYLKLYEQHNQKKEVINIQDLDYIIRSTHVDVDDILIKLPDGKLITFDEYIDGGYNILYSSNNHTTSPLKKKHFVVPEGAGSKRKRNEPNYWEKE